MTNIRPIGAEWGANLGKLLTTVRSTLSICSPYVTEHGIEFLLSHLTSSAKQDVRFRLLTDLSPMNVAQGATDPRAVNRLGKAIRHFHVTHLPKVHAKVFVQDSESAIVTSGNLTVGGLRTNYEYGLLVSDVSVASRIENDLQAYHTLGADVPLEALNRYSDRTQILQDLFRQQQEEVASGSSEFHVAIAEASDDLVRLRLRGGPMHTIFAETIHFLLTRHGPLTTTELHQFISELHPDLCDDTVERPLRHSRWIPAIQDSPGDGCRKSAMPYLERERGIYREPDGQPAQPFAGDADAA